MSPGNAQTNSHCDPEDLARQIGALVGKRGRIQFLTQAGKKEVHQLRAIVNAKGAWKEKDYPEMKQGSARWVDKLRHADERR